MTLEEFIRIFAGKQVDLDGFPPNQPFQCVDLVDRWSLYLGGPNMSGNARDYIGRSNAAFQWIPKGRAPRKGDIVVWGPPMGGSYGHVGVYLDGPANNFRSFDQNFGSYFAKLVRHREDTRWVAGYMRPWALKGVVQSKKGADVYKGHGDKQRDIKTFAREFARDRIRRITGVSHSTKDIDKNHIGKGVKELERDFFDRNPKEYLRSIGGLYDLVHGKPVSVQGKAARKKALEQKRKAHVYYETLVKNFLKLTSK